MKLDSEDEGSLCCQPADDSDTEPQQNVARKKDPSKRCGFCGETAFGEAALCLDCWRIHAASLATRRVAVNTLSGKPVLSHMPTIRGDMLVGDVKQVYMLGVRKTNPSDVEIVPTAPTDPVLPDWVHNKRYSSRNRSNSSRNRSISIVGQADLAT